ncbi:helix-turn-helix domain-containing protein [Collimonas fungivorans]|uniref:helix-turn-helix domain-containing protein n=1 Tax=Collimonas fungivorans TaxID=158899 RepID=UPI00068070B0|nr:helix-turn-helix domain-containing protein [Collimonas fungivorans]
MDKELDQFQSDLLKSVRDMKTGKAARSTSVMVSPIAKARTQSGLSQSQFAALMGVSVRTLQEWEQGRRGPSGAARTLLNIAIRHPEVLIEESRQAAISVFTAAPTET